MANTTAEQTLNFPYAGELFKAPQKKFQQTILLIPFFGGKKNALKRHVDFLNQLGYDVVVFNLVNEFGQFFKNFFTSDLQMGVKHLWAEQIAHMLNLIPGQKIVYAFSNPSASAVEAIASRHACDIAGLICDSGPSGNLLISMQNFYKYEMPIRQPLVRFLISLGASLSWSLSYKTAFHEDLNKLPKNFKILSIRGWKDKIISVNDIDKVFEPHLHILWQKLSLPLADHLNGLRDYPEQYCAPVRTFLEGISTKAP